MSTEHIRNFTKIVHTEIKVEEYWSMHSYQHREDHAIVVCQICGKAAGTDCCEDTGQGIACC